MNAKLTEEEMRHALFGTATQKVQNTTLPLQEPVQEIIFTKSMVIPTVKNIFSKN